MHEDISLIKSLKITICLQFSIPILCPFHWNYIDSMLSITSITLISDMSSEDSIDAVFPDDDPFVFSDIPSKFTEKIVWGFLLPIRALFYITVPDIRYKSMRRFFYLTFFMSIVWIGVTTYVLVWMTTVVGFTFSIPDAVMGLTFIAFGSSVPDAFASIIVAQQGKDTVYSDKSGT